MINIGSFRINDGSSMINYGCFLLMYTKLGFIEIVKLGFLIAVPGPPEQLMIIMTSQSSVNLTWKPPSEPNGVIEGYELTYFQEALVDG